MATSNRDICSQYESLRAQLQKKPSNAEELEELRVLKEQSKVELEKLESSIEMSSKMYVLSFALFRCYIRKGNIYICLCVCVCVCDT